MLNKFVYHDTDSLDCHWGELVFEVNMGFQDNYQFGFEDVCHGCAKKVQSINVDDFKKFFIEKFMER